MFQRLRNGGQILDNGAGGRPRVTAQDITLPGAAGGLGGRRFGAVPPRMRVPVIIPVTHLHSLAASVIFI